LVKALGLKIYYVKDQCRECEHFPDKIMYLTKMRLITSVQKELSHTNFNN